MKTANEFLINLQNTIDHIDYSFLKMDNNYKLRVFQNDITLPKLDGELSLANRWLEQKHINGKIHERGLIASLKVLSEVYTNKKIIFYDVGACYGYFSVIASVFFNSIDVIAIEGNPISARAISKYTDNYYEIRVENSLVSDVTTRDAYLMIGYEFEKYKLIGSTFKFMNITIKNFFKKLLNLFGSKFAEQKSSIEHLDSKTLIDLRRKYNVDANFQEIFKFDTEGYQSVFLPPQIDLFLETNPICLLEFDNPIQMQKFSSSNEALLQLFISRGYTAIWLDHRNGKDTEIINQVTSKHDRNSLVVLLPQSYA